VNALLAFHNRHAVSAVEEEEQQQEMEEMEDLDRINIFSRVQLGEDIRMLVGAAQFSQFSTPLLIRAFIKDKMELLERVLGRSSSQAHAMTGEVIKDMTMATDYPPNVLGLFLTVEEVTLAVQQLAEYAESLQSSSSE